MELNWSVVSDERGYECGGRNDDDGDYFLSRLDVAMLGDSGVGPKGPDKIDFYNTVDRKKMKEWIFLFRISKRK